MWDIIIQILMSAIASLGFSAFYRAPRSEYLYCGIGGALCWAVYVLTQHFGAAEVVAVFCSAVVVSILARVFAKRRRTPVTVFLVASIFPLVPGAYIYYTVYYLLNNESSLSAAYLRQTFTTAIAIAFGIMIVTSFPAFKRKREVPDKK